MDLLREKPMKQAELARALSLPPSSIGNKLARLKRKGLALPGEAGRWSLPLSQTSADHGSAISANTA
jgi:DNA-binding IclR family transcriptional regulator